MQIKFIEGQSIFSRMFNFAILGYSRNSRKLDACGKLVFYSIPAKFHPDPIWNNGASGFLKTGHPNKMISDMGSVPDPTTMYLCVYSSPDQVFFIV